MQIRHKECKKRTEKRTEHGTERHGRKANLRRPAALLLTALCALSLAACGAVSGNGNSSGNADRYSKTGTYFDTVISVTVYKKSQEKYLEGCMQLAKKYEDLLSTTISGSDISKINDAKGQPVQVDPETADLIRDGLHYSELSEGRFDITVGKLSKLWQKAIEDEKVPADSAVQEALKTVDYHQVTVDGNTVTLGNPEAELDLGGIAKGYIADRMKDYLEKNGVKSGIINLGGNVLTLGAKADGSSYKIGIQKPFTTTGETAAAVTVKDMSVVTSGTYERYFKSGGKIYHHILDLSNGYPAEGDVDSATIFTKKSVDGDALSTIAFLMGPEKGIPFIEQQGFQCVYIMKDGSMRKSSGIGSEIKFEKVNQ